MARAAAARALAAAAAGVEEHVEQALPAVTGPRPRASFEQVIRHVLILVLAGCVLAPAADPTFSTDVRVVNVFATVHDTRGKIVANLSSDDFVLDEDGRPQTIRYFVRESGLPLTIGLLIDTSLSQRHVLGREKSASSGFFKQVLREDRDNAFLIHFDREVELLQDVTPSRTSLQSALRSLDIREPKQGRWVAGGSSGQGRYGGTALYDAVLLASNELMRPRKGRRKALILLSDGVDIGSRTKLDDAIQSAQRADTLVYAVLFADPGFYEGQRLADGREVLQRISSETGGGFFEVSAAQPVDSIYRRIEQELRSQYSIGYVPEDTPAGPGFRAIHLTTKDPRLKVQARAGYYAQQ